MHKHIYEDTKYVIAFFTNTSKQENIFNFEYFNIPKCKNPTYNVVMTYEQFTKYLVEKFNSIDKPTIPFARIYYRLKSQNDDILCVKYNYHKIKDKTVIDKRFADGSILEVELDVIKSTLSRADTYRHFESLTVVWLEPHFVTTKPILTNKLVLCFKNGDQQLFDNCHDFIEYLLHQINPNVDKVVRLLNIDKHSCKPTIQLSTYNVENIKILSDYGLQLKLKREKLIIR